MTAFLDALDAPMPDALRYALAVWLAGAAVYLAWCGRQLQREQAETDRQARKLFGGAPPALTLVAPPPGCSIPNEGKPSEAGGITHPERIALLRVL